MLTDIERLRTEMMLRFGEGKDLTSSALIAKSHELDELVITWYRLFAWNQSRRHCTIDNQASR